MSDYFNYGFTEETWNAYCQRQRRMRTGESGVGLPNMTNHGTSVAPSLNAKIISTSSFSGGQIPTLGVSSLSNGTKANRIVPNIASSIHQPPPAIPVINSSTPIAVMTSDKRNFSNKKVVDFSVPPPGLASLIPSGPPSVFDGLPPSLIPPGIPPPPIGEFIGDDPFDYNYGGYEPTQESQWSLPPPAAESFHPPPGDVPPGDPTYDDRGDRDAWGRRHSRDKSPTPRSYDRRAAEYAERDASSRRRRRSRSRYTKNILVIIKK